MQATYSFHAEWSVPAPPAAVAAVVVDLEAYPQWWPQVRAVASLGPTTARVICRSALPYDLDLVLESVSQEPPTLEVAVGGDLDGRVRWHLEPYGDGTLMRFEQQVSVRGPLALASYVARPLLVWNHHRMMRGCEAGLRQRLRSAARPG